MKKVKQRSYRLFIRIIDKEKGTLIDEQGRNLIPTKWEEVAEVNLGSIQKPNKEILAFRLEPIRKEMEGDDEDNNVGRIFGRFFK